MLFWINYMEKVRLILHFLRATKATDLDVHHYTNADCKKCMKFLFVHLINRTKRGVDVLFAFFFNMIDSHPGAEEHMDLASIDRVYQLLGLQ